MADPGGLRGHAPKRQCFLWQTIVLRNFSHKKALMAPQSPILNHAPQSPALDPSLYTCTSTRFDFALSIARGGFMLHQTYLIQCFHLFYYGSSLSLFQRCFYRRRTSQFICRSRRPIVEIRVSWRTNRRPYRRLLSIRWINRPVSIKAIMPR